MVKIRVLKFIFSLMLITGALLFINNNHLCALSDELLSAIERDSVSEIKGLLSSAEKEDHLCPDDKGRTALMYACSKGKVRSVQYLLKNGICRINQPDYSGHCAWQYARFLILDGKTTTQSYVPISKWLQEYGAEQCDFDNEIDRDGFFDEVRRWHKPIKEVMSYSSSCAFGFGVSCDSIDIFEGAIDNENRIAGYFDDGLRRTCECVIYDNPLPKECGPFRAIYEKLVSSPGYEEYDNDCRKFYITVRSQDKRISHDNALWGIKEFRRILENDKKVDDKKGIKYAWYYAVARIYTMCIDRKTPEQSNRISEVYAEKRESGVESRTALRDAIESTRVLNTAVDTVLAAKKTIGEATPLLKNTNRAVVSATKDVHTVAEGVEETLRHVNGTVDTAGETVRSFNRENICGGCILL